MLKAFKYRIKDRRAKRHLNEHAKAVNFVWNYLNGYQEHLQRQYAAGRKAQKWPSHFDLTYRTSGTSKELGIAATTIGEVCKQFVTNRNRKKGSLRYRSSYGARRARGWIPFRAEACRVDGNRVKYLGQWYRVFGSKSAAMPLVFKTGHFVEDALGRWWVVLVAEYDAKKPLTGQVGIDLGLKSLGTLSNGRKIEAPQIYRYYEAKLIVAQRAGNKWRVKAIHAKIANCRRDFLHKLSTELAGQNALIAVGNVSSSRLKKTRLSKSVSDAGWSTFRAMLKYKSAEYIEVDEKFTTQTCSECGSIAGPKGYAGLNKREWDCPDCGASHDRDVNSAKVILARALSTQRRGDESGSAQ